MRNLLLFLILTTPLLAAPALAQEEKSAELDAIFHWAKGDTPGCAAAASLHGKVVVNRGYGSADLERDVPIAPNTLFDAGSLTKQFIAAATLLLAEEGRLSLSEDVRKYVPELPDYGQKITVDHLLTHTSGIRDWSGMLPLAAGNPDALQMTLRQRALNFAPGEEWAYSNGGYVLLREIVARTSGMPLGDFMRKRLFEPLGMKSTAYRTDLREIVKHRALAYDKEGGRWKMSMLLDNDRGGGGALLTTTGDLLLWNDALTNERLGAFVTRKLEEPATLSSGRRLAYGRGLFLDRDGDLRVLWHSGSAAGYKGLLARFPEQGLSISILCNSGDDTDRMAFARRMFDILLPGARAAAGAGKAPAAEPPVPADLDLDSRTGLFFSERTGEPLRLVADRGRLRIAGGPALTALTKDRFQRSGTSLDYGDFELHFAADGGFDMKTAEGTTTRYRRAVPYAPTAADLKAFAGRYESKEIGAIIGVAPGEGGLAVRLEHAPDKSLPLKPVDRDAFQFARITIRFVRDGEGRVVALDYSNPLLRTVRFTRLP